MRRFTSKEIWKQLKDDLIGKDSYRGVSLTYSWLANQWGHFSLGFIPTLLLHLYYYRKESFDRPALVSMLVMAGIWTIFELYNFLMPILSKKTSKSTWLYLPNKKASFNPPWKHVAFDTGTDLLYFYLGIICAGIFLEGDPIYFYILAVLVLIMIYPTYHWYTTKMYLQYANYPIQKRLSQWEGYIDPNEKSIVEFFVTQGSPGKHLLVYGSDIRNISDLGIGILTEKSNKKHTCCYFTAVKFYQVFEDENEEVGPGFWDWTSAEYLAIDDINTTIVEKRPLIKASEFLNTIQSNERDIRPILREKNVVWILGSYVDAYKKAMSWKDMLMSIGVDENRIETIKIKKEQE